MATQYYNLPTITPSTVANGPDAINGLANATDAALHTVEAMIPESADISEIEAKADAASVNAQAALNSATAANNTAAQATQTAGAAAATASAAQSASSTNAANIAILQSNLAAVAALLNFTVFTTATPARVGIYNWLTETYIGTGSSGATVTQTSGEVNIATTATGEYFKAYGRYNMRVNGTLAADGEMPVVGFTLASVGLSTPSEVITINNAGLGLFYEDDTFGMQACSIKLHTDGYMYIEGARDHTGKIHANYYFPCIFQAKQFGDDNQ